MKIERVELHHLQMPLVHAFETSTGRQHLRPFILVALHGGGLTGWGECVAEEGPWYSSETVGTAWHIMRDFLIPELLGQSIQSPADVVSHFAPVRGHAMARAGIESAVWDLLAQDQGISLAQMIGSVRDRVPVGVSVGIEPTVAKVVEQVNQFVKEGYARVKLKIKPGFDIELVRAVREKYPNLPLQVDANSAYTLDQADVFRQLDQFNLLLIEQPLHHDDIVEHAKLQSMVRTPICLDESVHSAEHAGWALSIKACKVMNIKVGRVGGLTAALQIHDMCAEHGVPVWCGGMLETNVGRAVNVALAGRPNFTLPGDISASSRYYHEDIAEPNFVLNDDSTISVPSLPGLGVQIIPERISKYRKEYLAF